MLVAPDAVPLPGASVAQQQCGRPQRSFGDCGRPASARRGSELNTCVRAQVHRCRTFHSSGNPLCVLVTAPISLLRPPRREGVRTWLVVD